MPIRLLPPDVVGKIAAGEVVERPASVVKELVENSLDAGATQVAIEVQGGGVRLIRVSDNGSGIPNDEVELALQRHATSKITGVDDLERIKTLGFRGEALASIAAVAELDILTSAQGEKSGVLVRAKGESVEKEAAGRPQGTTVTIRNLFRNFPARLKFLRSEASENGQIAHVVSEYALSFPEVRFSLTVDGRALMRTSGTGSLRNALAEVYGAATAQQMVAIKDEDAAPVTRLSALPLPKVTGFVSAPSLSRSNRMAFSFFVNRRWVQSRLLSRAVEEGYRSLLPSGRYPIVAMNIAIPPSELDVNIHPAKTEIRFKNEQVLFGAVSRAVRRTLSVGPPPEVVPKAFSPATAAASASRPLLPREEMVELAVTPPVPVEASAPRLPILRVVGQVSNCYIIAEGPEGLYLIDQHAAHERVLYEKISAQHASHQVEKQGLLEPVALELTPQEEEVIGAERERLAEFGFDLEPFGGKSYLLRAVPAMLPRAEVATAVKEALAALTGGEGSNGSQERLAMSIACHSAVRAGQTLSLKEMHELLRQLEQAKMPRTCPHGRPTMVHLSSARLEKEFGRT